MHERLRPATRRRYLEALGAAVTLMGLLAGCGGGTASSASSSVSVASATTSPTTPPPASPSPTAPSAGQADVALGTAAAKVAMEGDNTDPNGGRFVPASITVHVGDIVEWDTRPTAFVPHNVVFSDQPALSHRIGLGAKPDGSPGPATWQVRFTVAGAYGYVCTFHPGMTGTVTVG